MLHSDAERAAGFGDSNGPRAHHPIIPTRDHASRQETLTPRPNQPATRVAAVSSDTNDRSATGGCVARELVERPDVSMSFFVGRGGVRGARTSTTTGDFSVEKRAAALKHFRTPDRASFKYDATLTSGASPGSRR